MTVVTRQAMTDDNGDFISGTVVTEAFVDQVYDQIDDQCHSTTNPTIKPKATTDEVVTARGSKATLDERLDVSLEEDGTLKTQASLITVAQLQTLLAGRDVAINGSFDDWSGGISIAPDNWTLSGGGALIDRTGPGEADTFSFGAGRYAAKVTRVGTDAVLEQVVVAAADIADFAEIKGRKFSVAIKAKTAVASHARVVVDDGVTQTASSYHTGGGAAEHLTVTHTISNSATKLHVKLLVDSTSAAAYFGGVQMVFADFAPSDWNAISVETKSRTAVAFYVAPTFRPGTAIIPEATVSGVVESLFTSVGNVDAGEDSLMSYTLQANTLSANGKAVRITAWGSYANNANNKQLKAKFGGTTLYATAIAAHQAQQWQFSIDVVRTGAATERARVEYLEGVANELDETESGLNHSTTLAIDTTAAIVILFTGEAVATDDIVQEGLLVEVLG